ncbi:MAG: hypothetical protein HY286_16495 [Planctomycetes bacterium]|nr:hypothetical protein [Planctomycetota bacterium]
MAFPEIGLSLRPEQRMLMLPRMLQALDILQLPRHALADWLQSAAFENDALVVRRRRARGPIRRDNALDPLASSPARRTIRDHAFEQLAVVELPARIRQLIDVILGSLDGSGYRNITDNEIAASVAPPASSFEMQQCDAALATLDPPGVGARGVFDAILRQSAADPDRELIKEILTKHVVYLSKQRHEHVAADLDITIEELHGLLKKMRRFSSRPACGFDADPAAVVHPEVKVTMGADGPVFELRELNHLQYSIAPEAVSRSRDRSLPAPARAEWRERVESARTIIASLEQRRVTLERVVKAVMARQSAFLQNGPGHLRPLRMQELADTLSVHPSTISRAVAGKYVETPWGIYKLRDFFVAGVETSGGESATRDELREAVRRAFASEDPSHPLDDDAVVSLLKTGGFRAARRTIAKYRAELGIPSSWHRGKVVTAGA